MIFAIFSYWVIKSNQKAHLISLYNNNEIIQEIVLLQLLKYLI